MDNMVDRNVSRTLCIVQARLTSSRLPNKVLMPLGDGDKVIAEHVYERILMSKKKDAVIFAIPNTVKNNPLNNFLLSKKIPVFRGDENDVLLRFYNCAKMSSAFIIVRATCDNPLVDWELIDQAVTLLEEKNLDYVNTSGFSLGVGCEVFTFKALEEATYNAVDAVEREHVTPYFYRNPDRFKLATITSHEKLKSFRLTVDTQEDYEMMQQLYEKLYFENPIKIQEAIQFLNENSEIASINENSKQIEI